MHYLCMHGICILVASAPGSLQRVLKHCGVHKHNIKVNLGNSVNGAIL